MQNIIKERIEILNNLKLIFNGAAFIHTKYTDIHVYMVEIKCDSEEQFTKKINKIRAEIERRDFKVDTNSVPFSFPEKEVTVSYKATDLEEGKYEYLKQKEFLETPIINSLQNNPTPINVSEIDQLVREIKEVRDLKTKLTAELKTVDETYESLKQQFISILVDLNKSSWEVKGVGKASLSTRTFWQIKNQKKLRDYFIASNQEDMIKISSQAVTSFFNEKLEEGVYTTPESFEEDFGVSYFPKTTISLRTIK